MLRHIRRLYTSLSATSGSLVLSKESVPYSRILEIEAAAYPEDLQTLQDCESWEDIADQCDVNYRDLVLVGGESWYGLICLHRYEGFMAAEFADLAKVPGSPRLDWILIGRAILSLQIDGIGMAMREDTSYQVLGRYIANGALRLLGLEVKIFENDLELREGERFFPVCIYRAAKRAEAENIAAQLMGDL